jgi:hypothetical protein
VHPIAVATTTVTGIALRLCLGCLQAHAAEADVDLTKITSKVFFDIQIDGKPAGLFVRANTWRPF